MTKHSMSSRGKSLYPTPRNSLLRFLLGDSLYQCYLDTLNGRGSLYLHDPVTAIIIGSLVVAGATVGSQAMAASEEKKSQKSLLEFQEQQVTKAEAAAKNAEVLADTTAQEKIRKARLSKTQTILTSPLGVDDEATIGTHSLLGGE